MDEEQKSKKTPVEKRVFDTLGDFDIDAKWSRKDLKRRKYNLLRMTVLGRLSFFDLWYLLLVHIGLGLKRSRLNKVLLVAFCIPTLLCFDAIFFKTHNITVETPGSDIDLTYFYQTEDEQQLNTDVHGLSVSGYRLSSVLQYPFLMYKHRKNFSDIDWFKAEEYFPSVFKEKEPKNKPYMLTLGQDSLDLQMSAFLALKTYLGENIKYKKEMLVQGVELPKDYSKHKNLSILPGDNILTIGSFDIRDPFDYKIASAFYQDSLVTVTLERDNKVYMVKTVLTNLNLKKVITLSSKEDYTEFLKFANLEIHKIEGRSAGISVALSYYNNYIENVTRGRKIALSGGILEDGTIYPISGVDLKTEEAIEKGTEILFFAEEYKVTLPSLGTVSIDNYKDSLDKIKEKNANIKLVGVSSFREIIEYLKANP